MLVDEVQIRFKNTDASKSKETSQAYRPPFCIITKFPETYLIWLAISSFKVSSQSGWLSPLLSTNSALTYVFHRLLVLPFPACR